MLLDLSKEIERHPVEIALSWLSNKQGITCPVVGPGTKQQLKGLLNSLTLKLNEEQILRLEKPYKAKNIMGHATYSI